MSDHTVTRRHAFGLAKQPNHRERVKPRGLVKPLHRSPTAAPNTPPAAPPDAQTTIGHVSAIMTSNRPSLENDLAALAKSIGILNVRTAVAAADAVLSSTQISRAAANGVARARAWAASAP